MLEVILVLLIIEFEILILGIVIDYIDEQILAVLLTIWHLLIEFVEPITDKIYDLLLLIYVMLEMILVLLIIELEILILGIVTEFIYELLPTVQLIIWLQLTEFAELIIDLI